MHRFSNCLRLAVVALGLLAAVAPVRAEERPIKGSGSGGLDYYDPYLGGIAEVTHLGRTAITVPLHPFELYYFDNVVPWSFTLLPRPAGGPTYGDLLFADINADFDPDLGILFGTITFTGGTGRFADATGSASLVIVFDDWTGPFGDPRFDFAIEGTIDY